MKERFVTPNNLARVLAAGYAEVAGKERIGKDGKVEMILVQKND